MKAYKLSCHDDDHGQKVVIAKSSREAKGRSWPENCDCGFIERTCRREAKFDKYAPGPITTAHYLAEGWFWECYTCGDQCWGEDNPLIAEDLVFCNEDCLRKGLESCEKMCVPGCHESWLESRAKMKTLVAWLEFIAIKPH